MLRTQLVSGSQFSVCTESSHHPACRSCDVWSVCFLYVYLERNERAQSLRAPVPVPLVPVALVVVAAAEAAEAAAVVRLLITSATIAADAPAPLCSCYTRYCCCDRLLNIISAIGENCEAACPVPWTGPYKGRNNMVICQEKTEKYPINGAPLTLL